MAGALPEPGTAATRGRRPGWPAAAPARSWQRPPTRRDGGAVRVGPTGPHGWPEVAQTTAWAACTDGAAVRALGSHCPCALQASAATAPRRCCTGFPGCRRQSLPVPLALRHPFDGGGKVPLSQRGRCRPGPETTPLVMTWPRADFSAPRGSVTYERISSIWRTPENVPAIPIEDLPKHQPPPREPGAPHLLAIVTRAVPVPGSGLVEHRPALHLELHRAALVLAVGRRCGGKRQHGCQEQGGGGCGRCGSVRSSSDMSMRVGQGGAGCLLSALPGSSQHSQLVHWNSFQVKAAWPCDPDDGDGGSGPRACRREAVPRRGRRHRISGRLPARGRHRARGPRRAGRRWHPAMRSAPRPSPARCH